MFCRVVIIFVVSLNIGCHFNRPAAEKPNASQSQVIAKTENHKYKLEAIFSGYDVQVGERTVKVISSLIIRNQVTGQEVNYARPDGPSASDAHAYFTEVWSPDEEFLVLPLNRFLGFCIVRASDALNSVQKQSCSDSISLRIATPPKETLWHDFEKWDGDESFVFKAGLYGDDTRLKYEISSGRLTALDSNIIQIEGMNSKGKLAIGKSR